MTRDEARHVVCAVLREVAPEADLDLDHVDRDVTMPESLGLDSLDFLNFVAGLHQHTGIEIHERDYPQLLTVDDCISYLEAATQPEGEVSAPAAG
jgi:acyl carrier protein